MLHVTRLTTPIPSKYFLHNTELESATVAKYLGVKILDDLSWGTHVNQLTVSPKKQIVVAWWSSHWPLVLEVMNSIPEASEEKFRCLNMVSLVSFAGMTLKSAILWTLKVNELKCLRISSFNSKIGPKLKILFLSPDPTYSRKYPLPQKLYCHFLVHFFFFLLKKVLLVLSNRNKKLSTAWCQ